MKFNAFLLINETVEISEQISFNSIHKVLFMEKYSLVKTAFFRRNI